MRRVGVGAIKDRYGFQDRFRVKGEELVQVQLANLTRQFDIVKSALEGFAAKHRTKIQNNAGFRRQFQELCATIGVDPLAYSRGLWSEILGLGEFYYHLAVRIIEASNRSYMVCMAMEKRTGGIIPLEDLVSRLNKQKSSHSSEVSQDDVTSAIKKIGCFGNGFTLLKLECGQILVQSVPGEITMDQTMLLNLAGASQGRLAPSECIKKC
ncbi:unnamed protein product, partial [Protopolystoma xenopodis]